MRRLVAALLAAALLAAGGCTGGGEEPPGDPPGTLRVLAGSELKDVEPLAAQIRDATGVNLRFDYVGTLEGAERLAAGPPPGTDLAWFSSARYLNLLTTGGGLRASDIDERGLTDFFKGQTLTAGSSGWLADAYVAGQARLEGIINYESVLLGLNASGRLREPLELIYPKDGIITADYPLLLLNQAKRG